MATAIGLARRSLGRTAENPAVGAVVVRDGCPVGRGWTAPGGRPHAETEALRRAGAAARGATLYVSLEPCSHHGQTPPCADAVVAAGVRRVVVAVSDPDPRVSGRGLARLADAGIEVVTGIAEARAAEVNAGFFCRIRQGRPLFTWKTATTLDGRIAAAGGDGRWITGEAARAAGHGLRAESDAVLVGIGTVLADDPALTCRLPGLADRSPVRIVADSRLRLPPGAALVRTARERPTLVIAGPNADPERRRALEESGVRVLVVPPDPGGRPAVTAIAGALGALKFNRVLIESGGQLAAAFLVAGLIDRIAWFRAPSLLGGDAIAAIAPLGFGRAADARRFRRVGSRVVGEDILETYARTG